ncbi:MAG: UDP-N-acetylglucosamine-1-phosphate transferase, partial [Candidatus Helarchaeota archaeon]
VFNGDVGSLTIGYGLTTIAILGGQEFIVIICILPFVINAFQMLSSIGKIVEGRKIKYRPTKILPNGLITASNHHKAPLTLMRILLANKPKSEKRIALDILLLTSFSCFLGFISLLLTIFIHII